MSSIDCIAQSRSRMEPIKNIVNMKPNEIGDPRHTSPLQQAHVHVKQDFGL